jgi:DNA polymerase-3 subunit epsilon
LPLYIGKSVNIKQRILSHLAADHRQNKEMNLSQQLRRIDWIETAGELGALLTEAKLIKQLMPVYNQRLRRKNALCAWQLVRPTVHLQPQLSWANDLDFGSQENLYGLYNSQRTAEKALRTLAEQHNLCLNLLGVEKSSLGKPCFAYQLNKCLGVCVGKESYIAHDTRLQAAMAKLKLSVWPYAGVVGIREGGELHLVDHWCYLGTAHNEIDIHELLEAGRPAFDRDTYTLLTKSLKKSQVVMIGRKYF